MDIMLKRPVHHLFNLALNIVLVFGCEVTISSPYRSRTLLPRDSEVTAFCTTSIATQERLFWSISVANSTIDAATFTNDELFLHNNGYFLGQTTPTLNNSETTIQLYINDTNDNNGSRIQCIKSGLSRDVITETTFIVYEPRPVLIRNDDLGVKRINISWTLHESIDEGIRQTYTITVQNSSFTDSFSWQNSCYVFTAPDNAPPCEVYTFSVTATPVGATYTGDGCSVTSPVLSRMLPSLPNITQLESTLKYSLVYDGDIMARGFVLSTHFMPAGFCRSYPVTNYTMAVEGTSIFITESATSTNNLSISVTNLPENDVYTVRLVVSNDVGNISTIKRIIYTTDVQNVTAAAVTTESTSSTMIVQCYFVNGSTAEGCMVVLVGEFNNTAVNLTRDNSCRIINTSHPVSNYTQVFGYDIESDGSVGTLAVPGVISNTGNDMSVCNQLLDRDTTNPGVIAGVVVAAFVVLISLITVILIIFVLIQKYKKSHHIIGVLNDSNRSSTVTGKSDSTPNIDDEDKELDQPMPVYEEPNNIKQNVSVRTSGDGADHSIHYNCTTHTEESCDKADDVDKSVAMYAELREEPEHMYHVLEPNRPPKGVKVPLLAEDILPDEDAPELPPPFNPNQEPEQPPPLPPPYQDINDLPQKGAAVRTHSVV